MWLEHDAFRTQVFFLFNVRIIVLITEFVKGTFGYHR